MCREDLRARALRGPKLSRPRVAARRAGRRGVTLAISGRLPRLPTGGSAAVTWEVLRGRRVIARHAAALALRSRSAAASWTYRGRRAGRYRLRATLRVVVLAGLVQHVSTTTRTSSFRLR